MTQEDFKTILRDFPSKEQLKSVKYPETLIFRFLNMRFDRILEKLKDVKLSLECEDEEIWYKVLTFFALAYEVKLDLIDDVQNFPTDEEIFSEKTLELVKIIKHNMNETFPDDEWEGLIQSVNLSEIIEYAKLGKPLF